MFLFLSPETSIVWSRASCLMTRQLKVVDLAEIFDFPAGELLGPKFGRTNEYVHFQNQRISGYILGSMTVASPPIKNVQLGGTLRPLYIYFYTLFNNV